MTFVFSLFVHSQIFLVMEEVEGLFALLGRFVTRITERTDGPSVCCWHELFVIAAFQGFCIFASSANMRHLPVVPLSVFRHKPAKKCKRTLDFLYDFIKNNQTLGKTREKNL